MRKTIVKKFLNSYRRMEQTRILSLTLIIWMASGSSLMAQLPELPAAKIARWNGAGVIGGIPELPGQFTPSNSVTVTDKTSSGIQSAINTANSQGKTWVFLPDGEYNLSAQVNMTSGVSLVGESRTGVQVLIKFNTGHGFAMFKDRNCGIYRMTIIGRFPRGDGTFYTDPIHKWGCDTCNELPAVTNTSINMNNTDNAWVEDVNIWNSGRFPINISSDSYHNTIRNVDIRGAFNKGGGANGYLFIKGQDNLITRCTVTEIRHISIQTRTSEYNVIYDNDFRQEVSFHAEDAGNNLIEYNRITLPADMPARYYAIMGTWSIQHNTSLQDNYLFRNDCIEENHGGTRLYAGQFGTGAQVYAGPLDGKKEAIAAGRSYDHSSNFEAKFQAPASGYIYAGDGVTSIKDANPGFRTSVSGTLQVYPNPATSTFTVLLPNHLTNPRLRVFNLQGQEVYAANALQAQSNSIHFDLPASLEKGVYVLQLEDNLRRYSARLIVGD